MMIPFNKPDFRNIDIFSSLGSLLVDYRKNVEQWFAHYTGNEFNIFTDSCKSALYFFYASLDYKGKVAISPLTCITSILPLISAGFKPHYIDIDLKTFNMDPTSLKRALDEDTEIKTIQIIHLGGNPSKVDEIVSISQKKNLIIIEDCAQSLGATYLGINSGSWGDASCFSFRKNILSTGGGLVSVNDEYLATKIKKKISLIRDRKYLLRYYRFINLLCDKYINYAVARKLKWSILNLRDQNIISDTSRDTQWLMDKIYLSSSWEASLVFNQLSMLPMFIKKRQYYGKMYNNIFQDKNGLCFQYEDVEGLNIYTKYFLRTNVHAKVLIDKLLSKSINARHLEDTHIEIFQKKLDRNKLLYDPSILTCRNYFKIHDNLITLPLFSSIREEDVLLIGRAVLKYTQNL